MELMEGWGSKLPRRVRQGWWSLPDWAATSSLFFFLLPAFSQLSFQSQTRDGGTLKLPCSLFPSAPPSPVSAPSPWWSSLVGCLCQTKIERGRGEVVVVVHSPLFIFRYSRYDVVVFNELWSRAYILSVTNSQRQSGGHLTVVLMCS